MHLSRTLILGLIIGTAAMAQDTSGFFQSFRVHANVAQGVLYSPDNNYMTSYSKDGSFKWTDAVLSVTKPISDHLRVGAQVHSYSLGELGRQNIRLDWAFADYQFNSHFGIRAGQVKTPTGLYNDVQDIDAVYQWALLPQAIYPTDMRSFSLAHQGGVVYGEFSLKRAGSISYQAFGGERSQGEHEGLGLSMAASGFTVGTSQGPVVGADVRWKAPFDGLFVGGALSKTSLSAPDAKMMGYAVPIDIDYTQGRLYAQFEKNKLVLSGELSNGPISLQLGSAPKTNLRYPSWYVMASYHLTGKLTLGSYYSQYLGFTEGLRDSKDPSTYQNDVTLNGRFDFTHHLYFKLEGHYLHGTAAGFYAAQNPDGLQKDTRLMLARIGFTI